MVDYLVGISERIEQHVKRVVSAGWSSLSCVSSRCLVTFYLALTLRGPRLLGFDCNGLTGMSCHLRCPRSSKRGAQMLQLNGLSKQLRRAGAVETSQRLTGSACYPAISWCIRCSLVGHVLRTHTMLPPSTQCSGPRTACQS